MLTASLLNKLASGPDSGGGAYRHPEGLSLDFPFLPFCRFISFFPSDTLDVSAFWVGSRDLFPLDLVWLLCIVGGSLLLVQGVIGLDWGYQFSLRRVWVLFLPCCVPVDLIITAASCGFEHAVAACLASSPSVLLSAVSNLVLDLSLLVDSSLVLVGVRGFWSGCALVLIPVFAEACDGSSSNNFSSSVLVGYGRLCAGWAQVRSTVVATRFAWTGTLYRPSQQAVLRWAIIFKSGSSEKPKLLSFRLSVKLGSSFCGKRMVRTWLSLPTAVVIVVSAFPVDT
ncbi:hypothetical protein F2Q68_00035168 [Brassica cretica]|uniref:Transmembrane protein n=1 Tax=Brassica cretica TaxID=69181 RepID=A0A8S9H480_BRACR|nr:hypothetical protein F2Q68_00035168 [Brassica cretica]